jgi:hypothetical protein
MSRAIVLADWKAVQGHRIGLFGASAACRPFRNDPNRAPEAKYLEATPQVGAVAMTGSPLCVEPWKVVLERTLANPEHIGSLTSQYPADEAAIAVWRHDNPALVEFPPLNVEGAGFRHVIRGRSRRMPRRLPGYPWHVEQIEQRSSQSLHSRFNSRMPDLALRPTWSDRPCRRRRRRLRGLRPRQGHRAGSIDRADRSRTVSGASMAPKRSRFQSRGLLDTIFALARQMGWRTSPAGRYWFVHSATGPARARLC